MITTISTACEGQVHPPCSTPADRVFITPLGAEYTLCEACAGKWRQELHMRGTTRPLSTERDTPRPPAESIAERHGQFRMLNHAPRQRGQEQML